MLALKRLGMVSKSKPGDRRPDLDETDHPMVHFVGPPPSPRLKYRCKILFGAKSVDYRRHAAVRKVDAQLVLVACTGCLGLAGV